MESLTAGNSSEILMKLMKSSMFVPLLSLVLCLETNGASKTGAGPWQDRADHFLKLVNAGYQALYKVQSEAQWAASTDVTPAHDAASEAAGQAMAAFTGNPALIEEARELLKHRSALKEITIRQIDRALLNAAEGPMTNPKLVTDRIAAETAQTSTLNGFVFKRDGKAITPNEIDGILSSSRDLEERRAVWEASKQSGPALKAGLIKLRDLRNGVARELGHKDYFALQAAGYGMTTEEIVALQKQFMNELRPLYLQLHTWTKHKLAKQFNQPVPNRIPAHWINNRWGQEWSGIVEAANLDPFFKDRKPEWIVQTAEDFYTGIGFPKLPTSFWPKSDLYPVAKGDARKKNTHASCWHVDLQEDIRSLMSVEPNAWWFSTAHHELGHAYYFTSYTRPEVPPLLRIGANPAFHEGMGELISLASLQTPYLQSLGLIPKDQTIDETAFLLNDALSHSIPFIYWSSGTMTHWEADVYASGLPSGEWNARWWRHVADFQGIEPPTARDESFCDAATKTHINDNPCYYFSYAIATVLKFQLHDHIAKKILHAPPQRCNYSGSREAGEFLKGIMKRGGTEDWRKVLKDATGEELSTRAMLSYFQPLLQWLEKENAGRSIGWN